ncbi:hypothetical protein GCM10010313_06200 [Streptomyces violarus]|uniref:Uncharacterized protein n=1 Tax=Streptomyces violarus TaxID=67380 RepID=A0A7W4ZKG8_9ACTN|nr:MULTISPECIES: hypothetical protein [Streptomyces]MBB3074155.1 hypothetical protein [Streptomyces violarus]WRU03787.1 hypothetical protein VJ737_03860 [Streptomyces sp. CGMCC 4.1772]GHC98004.1 hypothetical protein GCM10010313_06200 [Streptomyces violarus]
MPFRRPATFRGSFGQQTASIGREGSASRDVGFVGSRDGLDIDTVDLAVEENRATWRRHGWPDGAIDVTLYALEEYGARFAELVQWTLDQWLLRLNSWCRRD